MNRSGHPDLALVNKGGQQVLDGKLAHPHKLPIKNTAQDQTKLLAHWLTIKHICLPQSHSPATEEVITTRWRVSAVPAAASITFLQQDKERKEG
eukprot:1161387-Pelagomonas_calceolata.AAC.10